MIKQMLQRQIKRYCNDEIRFKNKADRHYAAWKEKGDKYDYIMSQKYYAQAQRAKEIYTEYERQLANNDI